MKIWIAKDWYSLPEVAEYYGVSRRTLERWGEAGVIAISKVGPRRRMINRAALQEFDAKLRQESSQVSTYIPAAWGAIDPVP